MTAGADPGRPTAGGRLRASRPDGGRHVAGGRTAPAVLVLNAGSRSIKASVIEPRERRTLVRAEVPRDERSTLDTDRDAVADLVRRLGDVAFGTRVVGHRVVHGGESFTAPVVVDEAVLAALDGLTPLAPLHNPAAIATMRAALDVLPDRPHVAAFDTAFHASLPEVARRYPVPERWTVAWGVRRYGFHGLSVTWSVRRAAELLERRARDLDIVVAHLGGGSSVTAVRAGRSAWTSMGMTPLEGLMMGTRSGSIDPGVVALALRRGLDADAVERALDRESGLLAVGGDADMRRVLERSRVGDRDARLAVAMFVDRAAAAIAAAATRLRRVDVLVFTGGIGEHAPAVRTAIVRRVAAGHGDVRGPRVLVVEAREDVVIAEAALRLVSRPRGSARAASPEIREATRTTR